MTKLQEVITRLSEKQTKIFNNVFSHQKLDLYDVEYDELDTGIGGLIDYTEHVFSLHIEPIRAPNRFNFYQVEVSYFSDFKYSATVPAELLLDYLLNARINFKKDKSGITIDYNPSF